MLFFDFVAPTVSHALRLSSISFSIKVTFFIFFIRHIHDWLSQAFVLGERFLCASLIFLSSGYIASFDEFYIFFSLLHALLT